MGDHVSSFVAMLDVELTRIADVDERITRLWSALEQIEARDKNLGHQSQEANDIRARIARERRRKIMEQTT